MLPHPRLLPDIWLNKAFSQADEEAQGDTGVAVPRKQQLAWAAIAVPR